MINIEQGALGTLKENPCSLTRHVVEQLGRVLDVATELLGTGPVLREGRVEVQSLPAEANDLFVCFREVGGKQLPERRLVDKVAHSKPTAPDFLLIGRTDSPTGRPDLGAPTARILTQAINHLMEGKNHVSPVGNPKLAVILEETPILQATDLTEEHRRVDDHSVPDDTGLAPMKDSRGDQVKNRLLSPDHQGVPRVVSTLKAHNQVRPLGQKVDKLALALVAPLGTYNYNIRHQLFASASEL